MYKDGDIISNKYMLIEKADKRKTDGHQLWQCKCLNCGKIIVARPGDLNTNNLKPGCPHIDGFGFPTFFGSDCAKLYPDLVKTFNKMKARCYDPSNKDYLWYGKKGITICKEWLYNPVSFVQWALVNNYQTALTIDRIDSNKEYGPDNCRWITREENSRRAGKVNWILVDNKEMSGKQWAKFLNLPINSINNMVRKFDIAYTQNFIQDKMKSIEATDLMNNQTVGG